ncbi:hypothetical protein HAX54_038609, partial [Datura stramonium]|nr:hypothetical protein [Datura stramonium]
WVAHGPPQLNHCSGKDHAAADKREAMGSARPWARKEVHCMVQIDVIRPRGRSANIDRLVPEVSIRVWLITMLLDVRDEYTDSDVTEACARYITEDMIEFRLNYGEVNHRDSGSICAVAETERQKGCGMLKFVFE